MRVRTLLSGQRFLITETHSSVVTQDFVESLKACSQQFKGMDELQGELEKLLEDLRLAGVMSVNGGDLGPRV